MNEITEKTIDIEKILRSKMGSKARYVPGLLVGWLKKIIHQDQVNAFIWEHRDESGVEWLESTVRYLKMDIRIIGKENLPPKDDGKLYTFVSNHPLGGQDGVALGSIIGRHYDGRFRYLVNDLLMNLPGLAPVCIGINKTGRQGRDFPRMVEAGFKSDNHMLMFPAGLNSRPLAAVQPRHDIPRRRDVPQRGQTLRHIHRKAYTLADVRQEPHAVRVGTVGAAGGVQAKPLPTLPVGEGLRMPKRLKKA